MLFRSIIWKTNEIRERMFLPRLPSTGTPTVLPSSVIPNRKVLQISWSLPHRLQVESGEVEASDIQLTELIAPPWSNLKMHPLLEESITPWNPRYTWERGDPQLCVSYQLLKRLRNLDLKPLSVTWRKMLITQPALTCLSLQWNEWQCGDRKSYPMPAHKFLQNRRGITLGDIYDAVRKILLPRNAGLVPPYDCLGRDCKCYYNCRSVEQDYHRRMEDLEWKRERFEAKVIKKEDSISEGRPSKDLVVQVSGTAKFVKMRVIMEMENGEWKARVERQRI